MLFSWPPGWWDRAAISSKKPAGGFWNYAHMDVHRQQSA
jgi:hypothetical protein